MGGRILLVDDELELGKLVKMRLEANGYEVVMAFNGQEALDKAHAEHVDVIILDLMLPKVNGYEVCTMLKQDPRYPNIPVIIFTAMAQGKDEALAKECGADAYLRKPFQSKQLLETIQTLLPSSVPSVAPAVNPPAAPSAPASGGNRA